MELLNELPQGWKWVKLGDVIAESQAGFAIGERDNNGIIQIRMNNVDTRGNLIFDNFIRVPTTEKQLEKFKLKNKDVLFNNTNSVELVGKSALFLDYLEPVVYSNHFTRLRPNENQLIPEYLFLWLLNQWQSKTFEKICNIWIGQSAVKNDKLFNLDIPLPQIEEQQRLAKLLTEKLAIVEQAKKAAEAQLEAINQLPAALLKQAFSGEL